jgi:hypothetical protein
MSKGDNRKMCSKNCDKAHIRGTRIERAVEICATNLAIKHSPRTPMHRVKWRICENIESTARAICGIKPDRNQI